MVDNPTKFIIFILAFVVLLVFIITNFRSAENNNTDVGKNQENILLPKTQNQKIEGISENPVVYDEIVNYTDNGFTPAIIEIKSGATIRFINRSGGLMQISSVALKEEPSYSNFTQERAVENGGFFDLNFSRQGNWLYQNLNDKSKTGVVIVK